MRKWVRISVALAGLTGAGGMILAALDAHFAPGAGLNVAANMMLLNAAAALAVSGLACVVEQHGTWFVGAAGMLLCGSLLFGGDVSLRAFLGMRLFPMAAPIGGSLLICGWFLIAMAAVIALRRSPVAKQTRSIYE